MSCIHVVDENYCINCGIIINNNEYANVNFLPSKNIFTMSKCLFYKKIVNCGVSVLKMSEYIQKLNILKNLNIFLKGKRKNSFLLICLYVDKPHLDIVNLMKLFKLEKKDINNMIPIYEINFGVFKSDWLSLLKQKSNKSKILKILYLKYKNNKKYNNEIRQLLDKDE